MLLTFTAEDRWPERMVIYICFSTRETKYYLSFRVGWPMRKFSFYKQEDLSKLQKSDLVMDDKYICALSGNGFAVFRYVSIRRMNGALYI